jgi:sortase A
VRGRVFLFLFISLTLTGGLSHPTARAWLDATPSPTPTDTALPPRPTVSPTPTSDPFAHVPTATPVGSRSDAVILQPLPTPSLGDLPPTFTPSPTPAISTAIILPANAAAPIPSAAPTDTPRPGIAPERLLIPRLGLDAPVEPVGLIRSTAGSGLFEWAVPEHRAAGWLNRSAAFAEPGNTVLDGHHNVAGEVFRDLWILREGDEIILAAGAAQRRYRVADTLILPERDQPLDVRLANAAHIQPTADERLTLITCWPYDDNSHRVVVVAFPVGEAAP